MNIIMPESVVRFNACNDIDSKQSVKCERNI